MSQEFRTKYADHLRDRTFCPVPDKEQDTLFTLAIGRKDQNGTDLPIHQWEDIQQQLDILCRQHGTVVAVTTGRATTTDQDTQTTEDTAIFLIVNIQDRRRFRQEVGFLLEWHNLTSAGFAASLVQPIWNPTHNPKEK